ncbi:MAG: hypothetical protein ACMUHU_04140 [Thermoplasmatota archaeon]
MDENTTPAKLSKYLELLSPGSRYVLSFSPFFVNHLSVSLVSHLVVNTRKRILYVCIGRPHIFIQKMLQNRSVPIRNIHFMDMVLGVARRPRSPEEGGLFFPDDGSNVEFQGLYKIFKVDQEVDRLSLDEIDLIVFDNISELRTYNNDDRVRSMVELLARISDRAGKGIFILHINNRPNDGISELTSEIGFETVNVPNDVFK